jgi:hypothetical protein
LGDTATRILYNEPYDEARAAQRVLGLTSIEADQLPELAQGEGLWRIGQRAFVVRHVCTGGELDLFDTNARMMPNPLTSSPGGRTWADGPPGTDHSGVEAGEV